MNKEDKEMLDYYGEQLETIRAINKRLASDNKKLISYAKSRKRESSFLICLVISMSIWIATA